MIIKSRRFGEIEVAETDILQFTNGLPGFPDEKEFVLLPYQSDSPFAFLQSANEPNLSFLVVDPFQFFKDYEFEIQDAWTADLKLSEESPPLILNIVRITDDVKDMTVNLAAPLIINKQAQLGVQLVLEKSCYQVRQHLFGEVGAAHTAKGGR